LKRPWQETANQCALHEALQTFQPDVIFVWGMWNLSSRIAYRAEQWLPGRVAYSVASYWLVDPNVHEAYWKQPARRLWARALLFPAQWYALRVLAQERRVYPLALEHVTCVSEYVRRKLCAAGVLPDGARVIYNGIDPGPFVKAHQARALCQGDALHLIYVGGILPHKGVHTAIEALGLLRQRGASNDLRLALVGGGHPDYEARLRKHVAALDLHDCVTFYGRVPREQIASLLGDSDAFLFTSTWEEPIARTVMEAMAAGVPVIGTAVGGQKEMLHDGINALVFAPDDAAQLADCIVRLQHDPALRLRLADAGQRTVLECFTLERMVDQMEAWLQETVA